jgi:predicted nucleotidyltransferase
MQTASRPPIEIPQAFTDYLRSRTEIIAAYLFGSVAAGKAHKFSDVDVALLLAEGIDSKQKWDIVLEAMGEAESAFGRRADVAILNTSPTVFCYLILKHGRIIFDRATTSRPEFEARVYLAYFDLKPYLAEYDAAMFKRIKERGLGYGYPKTTRAPAKAG